MRNVQARYSSAAWTVLVFGRCCVGASATQTEHLDDYDKMLRVHRSKTERSKQTHF